MTRPIVILGCGFTGSELARQAVRAGRQVVGTSRSSEKTLELERIGVDIHLSASLTRQAVERILPPGAEVLASFPPDGRTDQEVAPALAAAGTLVYVSTTGVYGKARGHVDESTAVDGSEPRAAARLLAERAHLGQGATVLRAAGIYGPGRGVHRRLMRGEFRLPGDGSNVVSRIHVSDLVKIALALLGSPAGLYKGKIFVVADDHPVPQIEAIRWLCKRLRLPLPPSAPIAEVAPTLRHDRSVDNACVKRALSLTLDFPSYREGFEACLAAEGVSPRG